MGTHGERFWPEHVVSSAGKTDPAPWDVDYYDDSILDFDYLVRDLYGFLQNKNLLDKTILIVGSDHGQQWSTTDRIPLMFHFPASQYAGVHTENIQNMDVAPTILDY